MTDFLAPTVNYCHDDGGKYREDEFQNYVFSWSSVQEPVCTRFSDLCPSMSRHTDRIAWTTVYRVTICAREDTVYIREVKEDVPNGRVPLCVL